MISTAPGGDRGFWGKRKCLTSTSASWIFPGITQLGFTGPFEVLNRLGTPPSPSAAGKFRPNVPIGLQDVRVEYLQLRDQHREPAKACEDRGKRS